MQKGVPMDANRYLKTKKAAKYLGIEPSELRRHAREKRIPYSRPGGRIMLFDIRDLDAFIDIHRGK